MIALSKVRITSGFARALGCAAAILAGLLPLSSLVAGDVEQIPHGMIVTTDKAEQVRVLAFKDGTFRVTVASQLPDGRPTTMVPIEADGQPEFSQSEDVAYLRTGRASAAVSLSDGRLTVFDSKGEVLLDEYAPARALEPIEIEGQSWFETRVQFNRDTQEGLYGLGQHQNRQMNYNGEDLELAQHNMAITVPYLVSTQGYGILWDNASITRVGNPRPYKKLTPDTGSFSARESGNHAGSVGWDARYFLGERLVLERKEKTIDYQYLRWFQFGAFTPLFRSHGEFPQRET